MIRWVCATWALATAVALGWASTSDRPEDWRRDACVRIGGTYTGGTDWSCDLHKHRPGHSGH